MISRVIAPEIPPSARRRGRPRRFDRAAALALAGELFWRLGYEGTSVADLTAALGITPQSLYAAFGSKAELYREALAWYRAGDGGFVEQALVEEPTAIAAIGRLLHQAAREFTRPGRPPGCMISAAVLTCATENQPVADHTSALRRATLGLLQERLEAAVAAGELRSDADAAALARFVGAIIQGLSVQARDGATEAELDALATLALDQLKRHCR